MDVPPQTPMMAQYLRVKKANPDSLLFFRMGDFYEMFFEDAKIASKTLGIALTSRSKGEGAVPMAGVPAKSYTRYLHQFIRAGYKVAICDQLEDPEQAQGLVDRDVVRIVSAGTLTEEEILSGKENNYLLSLAPTKQKVGLAWTDLSTGRFLLDVMDREQLWDGLSRISPAEVIVSDSFRENEKPLCLEIKKTLGISLTYRPDWSFSLPSAVRMICDQFHVKTLAGFGIEETDPSVTAAGALLEYLRETQKGALPNMETLERFRDEDKCILDRATRSCLELTKPLRGGDEGQTLFSILDKTLTSMGGRCLREWILAPLRDVGAIQARQRAVAEFYDQPSLRQQIRKNLKHVLDIERLLSKLSFNRGNARDLLALKQSLDVVPEVKNLLTQPHSELLAKLANDLDPLDSIRDLVGRAISENPPLGLRDGGMIQNGYSAELDEVKGIGREGKDWIARFQAQEIERTGITHLKIGFNRVFGYYIEITNANSGSAPSHYIRKQTLKNAERFITPELKEFETKVLKSEERAKELEYKIFAEIRAAVLAKTGGIQATARALAPLDCFSALAETATRNHYVAPKISEAIETRITEGRHPVLERTLIEEPFVPNDTTLDQKDCRMIVLTGPNMSGKSTYIRQVALITLMAQAGSFVPAEEATIGVVDRIFTRIGSADEIARGNSTFMVEMIETANILRNATERSLIILDEVGRGTSTFDGLAIAWAIAEFIQEKIGARTLFATHYHQLTELANRYSTVRNFNVSVREWGEKIFFLHKIIEGGTDRSYGIHVAQLAGVPDPVLSRAKKILKDLEAGSGDLVPRRGPKGKKEKEIGQQQLW